MKVLLLADGSTDRGQLDSTLRLLRGRGAAVRMLADVDDATDYQRVEESCVAAGGTCGLAPSPRFNAWSHLGAELLRGIEHLEAGTGAPPDFVAAALRRPLFRHPAGRRRLLRLLRWCEHAVPRDAAADRLLGAEAPDLLCVLGSPAPGSSQLDYMRSARSRGVGSVTLHGDTACQQLVAALDAVEPGRPSRVRPHSLAGRLTRPLLGRLANRLALSDEARRIKTARQDSARRRRQLETTLRRATLLSRKQAAATERLARKREHLAEEEAARAAAERELARVFDRYLVIREWARRAKEQWPAGLELSESEQHTVAGLAPLWTASLDDIAVLRRWSGAVTGVRGADYDDPSDELSFLVRREMYVLKKEYGTALMMEEPDTLGGFGIVRAGVRCNEETLRYFHAVAALQDGSVLPVFRGNTRRRVVWEPGGGSGGFAYQFKSLCPNVAYLMTGIPETLLLAATYLAAAFPGAVSRFFDESRPDDLWRDSDGVDFLFAPESALAVVRPPRLDLTVDIGSLVAMEAERAAAHVRRAFEWGSPYIYSMLAAATVPAGAPIWEAIERYYWPHRVPPRSVQTNPHKQQRFPARFAHLIGWKRIRT
jgi:hypothetical protein